MAPKKRKIRTLKSTLTWVGEGETEKAFLLHIRSLYATGNCKIQIKSAGGKGPANVIDDAIGTLKYSGVDRVCALLDTDLPWPAKLKKAAQRHKILLIGSEPCIEGLMLEILAKPKPTPCNNDTCKSVIHPLLDGKPTDKGSYAKTFTQAVLDQAASRVEALAQIIKVMQGQ